jgi:hypothetical protein
MSVCVLPVPGGPWIREISRDARACWIAAFCEGLSVSLVYSIGASRSDGETGVGEEWLKRTCVRLEVVAGVSFCRRFIVWVRRLWVVSLASLTLHVKKKCLSAYLFLLL